MSKNKAKKPQGNLVSAPLPDDQPAVHSGKYGNVTTPLSAQEQVELVKKDDAPVNKVTTTATLKQGAPEQPQVHIPRPPLRARPDDIVTVSALKDKKCKIGKERYELTSGGIYKLPRNAAITLAEKGVVSFPQ